VPEPGRGQRGEHADTNTQVVSAAEGARPLTFFRSAAINGANAAGKTNLLRTLDTMRRVVLTSHKELKQLPVAPFRFDAKTCRGPTLFEVIALIRGVRYQYGFRATTVRVYDEWLFAFPKGRSQRWFERSVSPESGQESFVFGDKMTGDKEVWRRATRSNALFLSTAIQLNSEQLQPVFDWFTGLFSLPAIKASSLHHTVDWYRNVNESDVLDFLTTADLAISGLRVEQDQESRTLREFLANVKSVDDLYRRWRLYVGHRKEQGDLVELESKDESDGTQKMLAFAGPWLSALSKGRLLLIDELHDNLHPLLARYLVELFHSPKTNPKGAQLVFTTHETSILSQDVFRRDQIWFCERDEHQATQLYPLSDFRPRKGIENLERSYLAALRRVALSQGPFRDLRRIELARRKSRSASRLQRHAPRRESYERVLVVCEGAKTEPIDFSELKDHYRLSNANIRITPADGSDPVSIVRTAKSLQNDEIRREDSMQSYRKAQGGLFKQLLERLEAAKQPAARSRRDALETGEDNPSTEIHELVDYLQHLKALA
jgi:AAA15 family ATPase/GTPase